MDQGPATLSPPLSHGVALQFATALGLRPEQIRTDLPIQVVSTGLPYLLLPVTAEGLAASQVTITDLPSMLSEIGAAFVYVLDPDRPEGRTWNNRGATEDVATGSAAGPAAAYLVNHCRRSADKPFHVHQGRFVGRPSRIAVRHDTNGSIFTGSSPSCSAAVPDARSTSQGWLGGRGTATAGFATAAGSVLVTLLVLAFPDRRCGVELVRDTCARSPPATAARPPPADPPTRRRERLLCRARPADDAEPLSLAAEHVAHAP